MLIERLKEISCFPEPSWPTRSIPVLRDHLGRNPTRSETLEKLELYRMTMLIQQIRLGRAVQPEGPLHALAPIIGSIRLKVDASANAAEYLHCCMMKALETEDHEPIKLIAQFGTAPLGNHPNCRIWDAIFDLMDEEAVVLDPPQTSHHLDIDIKSKRKNGRILILWCRKKLVGGENRLELCVSLLPERKEVKAFVVTQKLRDNRFKCLPSWPGEWKSLWESSGAGSIIVGGTRGKAG